MTPGAIILARGLGTRLRRGTGASRLTAAQTAVADAGLKTMMPVGRPLIDHILSALADAGVTEACLVIGPEHDAVREHFAAPAPRRVRVRFAVQERPLGTADAVRAAESAVVSERFIVINGDNYYPADVLAHLAVIEEPAVAAFARAALIADGLVPAERIARFALLEVGGDGYLRRIVEKPDAPTVDRLGPDAPVSMNCWLFIAWIPGMPPGRAVGAPASWSCRSPCRARSMSGRCAFVRCPCPLRSSTFPPGRMWLPCPLTCRASFLARERSGGPADRSGHEQRRGAAQGRLVRAAG